MKSTTKNVIKKIIDEQYQVLLKEDQETGQFSNLLGGIAESLKQNLSNVEKALALYQQLKNGSNQQLKNDVEFPQIERLLLGLKKSSKQSMALAYRLAEESKRL